MQTRALSFRSVMMGLMSIAHGEWLCMCRTVHPTALISPPLRPSPSHQTVICATCFVGAYQTQRRCAEGGDLLACDEEGCPRGFCQTCLQRNFGQAFVRLPFGTCEPMFDPKPRNPVQTYAWSTVNTDVGSHRSSMLPRSPFVRGQLDEVLGTDPWACLCCRPPSPLAPLQKLATTAMAQIGNEAYWTAAAEAMQMEETRSDESEPGDSNGSGGTPTSDSGRAPTSHSNGLGGTLTKIHQRSIIRLEQLWDHMATLEDQLEELDDSTGDQATQNAARAELEAKGLAGDRLDQMVEAEVAILREQLLEKVRAHVAGARGGVVSGSLPGALPACASHAKRCGCWYRDPPTSVFTYTRCCAQCRRSTRRSRNSVIFSSTRQR